MNRSEGSLIGGRSQAPLSDAKIRSVTNTFVGLDQSVPFQLDEIGLTRFVVEDGEEGPQGKVYFGPDVYPGPGVLDPNSALSMKAAVRSEEHTSELQSLMRSSYAVFCLKKNKLHTI